jgi:hypothetical protein
LAIAKVEISSLSIAGPRVISTGCLRSPSISFSETQPSSLLPASTQRSAQKRQVRPLPWFFSLATTRCNPASPLLAETRSREILATARTLGLELHVLNARAASDFDTVFATLDRLGAGGLVIRGEALFTSRSEQLAALALRHAIDRARLTRPVPVRCARLDSSDEQKVYCEGWRGFRRSW